MRKIVYVKDATLAIRLERRHKQKIIAAAKESGKSTSTFLVDLFLNVDAADARKAAK